MRTQLRVDYRAGPLAGQWRRACVLSDEERGEEAVLEAKTTIDQECYRY
jgi:hypothetical protein